MVLPDRRELIAQLQLSAPVNNVDTATSGRLAA